MYCLNIFLNYKFVDQYLVSHFVLLKRFFQIVFAFILAFLFIVHSNFVIFATAEADQGPTNLPSRLQKIAECLRSGNEAILQAEAPPRCVPYLAGVKELDKAKVEPPYLTDYKSICAKGGNEPDSDQRLLERDAISVLAARLKDSMDPHGIRIIGGIYCQGFDITGLDINYSIALDRSVFGDSEKISLRNFKTTGDFSLDNSVMHHSVNIISSTIGGTIYVDYSSLKNLTIAASNVGGEVNLKKTNIIYRLSLESTTINGDFDASYGYFAYLSIRNNKISGMLDLGQTHARCFYDLRKNDIGGIILTNFGFGLQQQSGATAKDAIYEYDQVIDEIDKKTYNGDPKIRYSNSNSFVKNFENREQCVSINPVSPATLVLVDNHIKASMCLRVPRWLKSMTTTPAISNIYMNENLIDGALWMDFDERFGRSPRTDSAGTIINDKHIIGIFNVTANTLVLNFNFKDPSATINLNGLHFKKVYNSRERCEAAVSLRAPQFTGPDAEREFAKTTFPPKLRLPNTQQILTWIDRNSFKATQPFAEFVNALERAGDSDGARDLKVEEATFRLGRRGDDLVQRLMAAFSTSVPRDAVAVPSDAASIAGAEDPETPSSNLSKVMAWIVDLIDYVASFTLWLLVDHGYRPAHIFFWVFFTIAAYLVIYHGFIRVVGFSVAGELAKSDASTWVPKQKIHTIGILFLFDHLLPAYKLRNIDYNVLDYYERTRDGTGQPFSCFGIRCLIKKASAAKVRKFERYLNFLRFLGLIYFVFIIAALSNITK